MTNLQKRSLLKAAALSAVSLAVLAGCGKKEEAVAPAAAPVAAAAAEPLKIGFMYVSPVGDGGWTFQHEKARLALQAEFGDKIQTSLVESVPEGPDAERVLRDMVGQGNKLVFATSFGYMEPVQKVAADSKAVKFEHATGYQRSDNVATYNARFHEGRAVCGTIAGHLSKTGKAGYIGSFPIPEVVLGINSFVLAARKVNPAFEITPVYISTWNDPAKEADAARAMIDQGIDIIAQHTDGPAALQVAEERGIVGGFGQGADMSAFAPKAQLTSIIDNWGPTYVESAEAVIAGTWASADRWPGLKEGEVQIGPYNASIPADVVAAAEAIKAGQIDGSFNIFTGPINDHTGAEKVAAGVTLTDAELLSMDWYVEGVNPPA